jgi:ABC-type transport system substrate-binding protein
MLSEAFTIMRMSIRIILTLAIGALLVGACAAPAPTATPAPATSSSPQITLTTNPDPAASTGETELIIDVKDASGQPLSGAVVLVTVDMSGHGMSDAMQGESTDQGNGRYATKVPFNMAGDWKVTVEVRRAGELLIRQDFVLPVQ